MAKNKPILQQMVPEVFKVYQNRSKDPVQLIDFNLHLPFDIYDMNFMNPNPTFYEQCNKNHVL